MNDLLSSRVHSVLNRLRMLHPKSIDLSLERILSLLRRLGNPQFRLPSVVHVAGTNGKGSTIAFLRAILEEMGWRVHVYTSPHLVSFHERIRVAGEVIDDRRLLSSLEYCERVNGGCEITFFEMITAVTFHIFAQTPADVVLLETGLGGRLDATNVVEGPAVTAITRISFDHMQFLGNTLEHIALEKAGILKDGVPVVIAPQSVGRIEDLLYERAFSVNAPVKEWTVELGEGGFLYRSQERTMTLPSPRLLGVHQIFNAGVAIACSEVLSRELSSVSDEAIYRGVVEQVEWPGRLQRLTEAQWSDLIPDGWEIWLDGGHNDSAGEVLAHQARLWTNMATHSGLYLIVAMGERKDVQAFLAPLATWTTALRAIPLNTSQVKGMSPQKIVAAAAQVGIMDSKIEHNLEQAIHHLKYKGGRLYRILICGSLYLVGDIFGKYQIKRS